MYSFAAYLLAGDWRLRFFTDWNHLSGLDRHRLSSRRGAQVTPVRRSVETMPQIARHKVAFNFAVTSQIATKPLIYWAFGTGEHDA